LIEIELIGNLGSDSGVWLVCFEGETERISGSLGFEVEITGM